MTTPDLQIDQRLMRAVSDPRLASRRIRLSFACNDPDNGLFTGRVSSIEFESLYRVGKHPWEASLALTHIESLAFTVDSQGMRFRLCRIWFPFVAEREWFGNWCWNAYTMRRPQAKRLLGVLRDSGRWACEAGPTTFFNWFNRK